MGQFLPNINPRGWHFQPYSVPEFYSLVRIRQNQTLVDKKIYRFFDPGQEFDAAPMPTTDQNSNKLHESLRRDVLSNFEMSYSSKSNDTIWWLVRPAPEAKMTLRNYFFVHNFFIFKPLCLSFEYVIGAAKSYRLHIEKARKVQYYETCFPPLDLW